LSIPITIYKGILFFNEYNSFKSFPIRVKKCSVSDSEKKPTFFSLFLLRSASVKPYISFTHKTQHHLCTFQNYVKLMLLFVPCLSHFSPVLLVKPGKCSGRWWSTTETLSDMRYAWFLSFHFHGWKGKLYRQALFLGMKLLWSS